VGFVGKRWFALGVAATAYACGPGVRDPGTPPPRSASGHRAILVSFDAFNKLRFERTLDSATVPAFTRLFREGACSPYVLTQWATQTPMAHAALWTGAWAHENGVGRQEAALPETAWTWLEQRPPSSLYASGHMAAEPLWITAGRSGLSVFAHHPTHAPQPPAYRRLDRATPERGLEALRAEAAAVLGRPDVRVMNGYNERHRPRVVTAESHSPRAATEWRGVDAREPGDLPPLEVAWDAGPDSLFALIRGSASSGSAGRATASGRRSTAGGSASIPRGTVEASATGVGYTEMIIARTRDAREGVIVRPFPADTLAPPGDTTARHFSAPLMLRVGDASAAVAFRLFELTPDAQRFVLAQTGIDVVQGNRPGLVEDYVAATGGWLGNAYGTGLGAWLGRGGEGTAESRQLDIYAYQLRQWLRGTRWAWSFAPDLFIDYNPSSDSFDHEWYGLLEPAAPHYDAGVAAAVRRVRDRGYALLDRHLALLMDLTLADTAVVLFVTSDHGMRPVWRTAHPNAILHRAGLLALDGAGEIDLARTQALSPDGYGIVVNRTSRKGGIVPAGEEADVVARARRALDAARDDAGAPLVARIYGQAELDSLFGSGPSANSLYVSWAAGARGDVDVPFDDVGNAVFTQLLESPRGDHGATLPYTEGMAGFCAFGHPVAATALPVIRQIDVAPTVSAWLGIAPPRHARGRSILDALLRD
jgi:Type I phosphodiesterase / nucleotide pyrophosphatase